MSVGNEHDDEMQEYICQRYAGASHEQARNAADRISRRRVRIGAANVVPYDRLSPDMDLAPYTMDARSDVERETSWNKSTQVDTLMEMCTPHQRVVLDLVFGLTTGEAMSHRQTAMRLGVAPQSVDKAMKHIRHKASVCKNGAEWAAYRINVNQANAATATAHNRKTAA